MKLLRLKIFESFRSLQEGFEIQFPADEGAVEAFAPYILAGCNGSGKSNVLEVLAAVFYHLECQFMSNRPSTFEYDEEDNPSGFKEQDAFPAAFEVEYLISAPNSPASSSSGTDVPYSRLQKS